MSETDDSAKMTADKLVRKLADAVASIEDWLSDDGRKII